MGNGTRSGFVASDKAEIECDVGLGLKTERTESIPCKKMMGLPNIPYHQQPRPSSPSESCGGGGGGFGSGGGGGGGPIFCNAGNQVAYMNDISDVVGAASGAALPRTLHHFNTDTTFKTSAGMTTSLRVPFTATQWQELERQTIIYKHMMASVPVPPELLIPINKRLSAAAAAALPSNLVKGCLGLGYSNGSDPEPWRCRRTDGKKWRCSRDVAPDQKYCERHAHKNRPRSRKPVEVHAHFNNNNKTHSLNLPAETTKPYHHPKSHFLNQTNHHISPLQTVVSATSYDQPRCSDWFLKGETAPGVSPNQQWQQLMQSKVGMNKDRANLYQNVHIFQQQQEEEPINSSLATDQCNLLLGPKLGTLEGALSLDPTERPRDFIDAWSTAERDSIDEMGNDCSASSNAKLPISSLTLSMCGGNESNEENQHGQLMGLGILDSERESEGGSVKPQPVLNWMSPGSWMGSPPGGPLAEALCLGITSTAKAASPHGRSSTTTSSSSSGSKSSSGDSRQGHNLIK